MNKTILILVVEDNPDMRSGLQLALELEGYNVLAATDGAQALELLATSVPDLFLIDLKMPRMDGLALLAETRKNKAWRDVPVIVVTAVAESAIESDVKAQGVRAYFTKPFDLEALLETVARVVRSQ